MRSGDRGGDGGVRGGEREPAEGAAEALARLEELVEQELAAARPAAGGDGHERRSFQGGLALLLLEELAGHLGQGEGVDGPVDEGVGARPAAEPLVLEPVEDEDDRAVGLGVGLEVAGQAEAAVGGDRHVGDHQVGLVGLGQDQGVVAVDGLQERDLLAGQLQALEGEAEAVAEAWVVGDQHDLDHGRSRSARFSIQSVTVNTRDGYHVPSRWMVTT